MNLFTNLLSPDDPETKCLNFINYGNIDWRHCECDHFGSLIVIDELRNFCAGPCEITIDKNKIIIESIYSSLITDLEYSNIPSELNVTIIDIEHKPLIDIKFIDVVSDRINQNRIELIAKSYYGQYVLF